MNGNGKDKKGGRMEMEKGFGGAGAKGEQSLSLSDWELGSSAIPNGK